jgi:hypothetical protein
MRVTLKTEGGIAHFPGLAKPITVDTNGLASDLSARLHELVEATAFFQLPNTVGALPAGADMRTLTVTVEVDARVHRVSTAETAAPPPLRALVDFVRQHGKRAS